MKIQISAGQGPLECQLAVTKLTNALELECGSIEIISKQMGDQRDIWSSVQIQLPREVDCIGTIQWICKSPYRSNHLRKNWYIGVQNIDDLEAMIFDEKCVRFETFRSSGKGGQHVNKTESAVRAIHIPTGISTISQDERSQYQNKAMALKRLQKALDDIQIDQQKMQNANERLQHFTLERGNPIRIYRNMNFERVY